MTHWTFQHSIAEGLRNIVAAPFLFGALTVVTACVTGTGAVADLIVTQEIISAEQGFLAAGGDILRATATEGVIDAGSCSAVRNLPGVAGASGVFEERMRIAGRPDHVQTVLVATPGIEQVVDTPYLASNEVIVSKTLADRWAWSHGSSYLQLVPDADLGGGWEPPSRAQAVAATVDLSRLGDAASTSIIVTAPPIGSVKTCLVRAMPHMIASVAAALPASLAEGSGTTIQVTPQIYTGEFGLDPAADFADRATRWAGVAAGLVLGLLLAFITWTRRQRSALYAVLGLPDSGGVQVRWTESLVPLFLGAPWGALWAALGGLALGIPSATALAGAALQSVTSLAVASAIAIPLCLWRPAALTALKDR